MSNQEALSLKKFLLLRDDNFAYRFSPFFPCRFVISVIACRLSHMFSSKFQRSFRPLTLIPGHFFYVLCGKVQSWTGAISVRHACHRHIFKRSGSDNKARGWGIIVANVSVSYPRLSIPVRPRLSDRARLLYLVGLNWCPLRLL